MGTDPGLVGRLLATQFPSVAAGPVSVLGGGADHQVFAVGPDWAFRFPRRSGGVVWFERELVLMTTVRAALGTTVAGFEMCGRPTPLSRWGARAGTACPRGLWP